MASDKKKESNQEAIKSTRRAFLSKAASIGASFIVINKITLNSKRAHAHPAYDGSDAECGMEVEGGVYRDCECEALPPSGAPDGDCAQAHPEGAAWCDDRCGRWTGSGEEYYSDSSCGMENGLGTTWIDGETGYPDGMDAYEEYYSELMGGSGGCGSWGGTCGKSTGGIWGNPVYGDKDCLADKNDADCGLQHHVGGRWRDGMCGQPKGGNPPLYYRDGYINSDGDDIKGCGNKDAAGWYIGDKDCGKLAAPGDVWWDHDCTLVLYNDDDCAITGMDSDWI